MRDTELYQNLLGIVSPWTVDSVTMDVETQRVDVTVSHPPRILFSCPECGTESPVFDHAEERVWRHLDSCQFFSYLHARVPRIACAAHGVRQVSVPWAEARGRFTKLFERLAIDVLTVNRSRFYRSDRHNRGDRSDLCFLPDRRPPGSGRFPPRSSATEPSGGSKPTPASFPAWPGGPRSRGRTDGSRSGSPPNCSPSRPTMKRNAEN